MTDFISNSVMTGFLSGVAVQVALGQIGDLTGFASEASIKLFQAIDTLLHFRQIHGSTLAIGLLTIGLVIGLEYTRFRQYAYAVALIAVTLLVSMAGLDSVALVGDSTPISTVVPQIHLPDLSLMLRLVVPALAIAIVGLVQAAGVSNSIPNPDGEFPDPSGDFRGQGIANIATGFFGGLPVGGSLSGTALIRLMGGRTRWANIFTGVFGLVLLLLFGQLIEALPMPALAGLLVIAGAEIIDGPRILTAWRTGSVSTAMMLITFTGVLFMPIQYAVMTGVFLHILQHVFRSAEKVRIERIVPLGNGRYAEAEPPEQISNGQIVILQPVGSLFFAGAARFEDLLPVTVPVERAVVILRLRDRDEVGSTFIEILERYSHKLQANGCRLILVGVSQRVYEQLQETGLSDLIGHENIFKARSEFNAALEEATVMAQDWLE
jgi:SulP family sulfate permease